MRLGAFGADRCVRSGRVIDGGAGVRAHAQDELDRVVASVDGDPITLHDLKTFAAINKVTLSDPGDLNSPETKSMLKGVISERMLESEVKKYKDQIDDRQIDEYISNLEQSNHLTDEQLRAQLQSQGHSYEEFRNTPGWNCKR